MFKRWIASSTGLITIQWINIRKTNSTIQLMEIYPILFEQLRPGLSGLCYASWSYANSKYFQEINGTLHTLCCVLFCFVFFNNFFSIAYISYLSEQIISIINQKETWGKLKRTLTWSYLLTYFQTYPCHDIMIYQLNAIKLKSLNAIFHTLVNSSMRRSRKEYIFLFKEKTC